MSRLSEELAREQDHLDKLYARVDQLRAEVEAQLGRVLDHAGRRAQDLLERDARAAHLAQRRAALDRAENGLCFGRLDRADGSCTYVGRMGLRSAPPERRPLLLDWRAPGARDFYAATAARNNGVVRRRHLRTEGRRVVGVEDELLDLVRAPDGAALVGEGALMAALTAHRTGRMGDVVATLQAEQDEIIRMPPYGALVVQGGPGTGKTAVALHRAAYLLYAHPLIAERGVLVVGPNDTFLAYVEQVLPSLGESQVVLTTAEELYPGVVPAREEPAAVARVKGRAEMAQAIARAVRARQGSGDGADVTFQGDTYHLDAGTLGAATRRARATALPHNVARRVFRREVLDALTGLVADHDRALLEQVDAGLEDELRRLDAALAREEDLLPARVGGAGTEVTGTVAEHELPHLRRELLDDPGVAAVLEDLWPLLTPEALLEDLLADPERLRAAAGTLAPADRAALRRDRGSGWTAADVPLLDEAAELLGTDDGDDARERARREEAVRYARRVLAAGSDSDLLPSVTARDLAERFAERDTRTLAERAAADRTWTYGHVIVDEAQELSPMAWRMVARRCPATSMTVVGDLAQGVAAAGAASWEDVFDRLLPGRWRSVTLSVSYRTPREVMAAAEPVLRALDPAAAAPACVRAAGVEPWRRETDAGALAGAVVAAAREEAATLAGGNLAVIAPGPRVPELGAALAGAVPGVSYGDGPDLRAPVTVLTPDQAKGLEFDGVLVADPAGMLAAPRGLSALYVAMTRPTRRLGVVHAGPVPGVLAHLPAC
ncbi:HelD family protein [Georgenia sp. AZ-5]|uniref:HelD family protein n=1 Tax=Georgenia sp. AZ-5 TaxID=3367526 RepID=UPI00375494D4